MVESAGFENRYLGATGIAGSNPALSAITTNFRFRFIENPESQHFQHAERCRSGLTGTPGKRVWAYTHRRFESCPLRQKRFELGWTGFEKNGKDFTNLQLAGCHSEQSEESPRSFVCFA